MTKPGKSHQENIANVATSRSNMITWTYERNVYVELHRDGEKRAERQ